MFEVYEVPADERVDIVVEEEGGAQEPCGRVSRRCRMAFGGLTAAGQAVAPRLKVVMRWSANACRIDFTSIIFSLIIGTKSALRDGR